MPLRHDSDSRPTHAALLEFEPIDSVDSIDVIEMIESIDSIDLLDSIDSRQGNEYAPASWGVAVSRFVLFAGLSRGVDMETSLGRRIFSRALEFLPGRFSSEDDSEPRPRSSV